MKESVNNYGKSFRAEVTPEIIFAYRSIGHNMA